MGVAEAGMGRLAASGIPEEAAGAVWTGLLALLLTSKCHHWEAAVVRLQREDQAAKG